jgi:mono/diheme cytochrome c family protein
MMMLKKLLLGLMVLVLVGAIGFVGYFKLMLPRDIPVPSMQLPTDPAIIERGKYLANHVAVCMDCHSKRNWDFYAGPLVPGTLGQGGEVFDEDSGLPGTVISKNITPYSLGDWSDGELYRVITGGLQKNGDALFPLMPYDAYRTMDKDDLLAIMAYLRTLSPIENDVPKHQLGFPLNLIVNAIPKEAELRQVNREDTLEYGEYLANLAGCTWCHTPLKGPQIDPSRPLAGGHEFYMEDFVVRAGNISSDEETGIGNWSQTQFIETFRRFSGEAGRSIPLAEDGFNTLMPWTMYADMKDEDLAAIYQYLMTSEPMRNAVVTFEKR